MSKKETSEAIIKFFVESYTAPTKEKREYANWCAFGACAGLYPEEVRYFQQEAVSRLHHKHWRRVKQEATA
jgi:hypothetical protein